LTVVVPSPKVEPETGKQTGAIAPSTISFAVAEKVTAAPEGPVASAVISEGSDNAGGVVSSTVTSKLLFAVLPAASVAEQLTVVVPRANVPPEAGKQDATSSPSTKSWVAGLK
jgi:hypothetical protein